MKSPKNFLAMVARFFMLDKELWDKKSKQWTNLVVRERETGERPGNSGFAGTLTESSTTTMAPFSIPLRVGVVQFCPKIGQVEANIARARELCQKLKPKSIDLLCFPEMAFSGYVFNSAEAISPFLERPQTGPTSQFCKSLAEKLGCYVVAGYPEKLASDEEHPQTLASTQTEPTVEQLPPGVTSAAVVPDSSKLTVGANSAVLYGPGGSLLTGYRKTNLFETDMTWAKPGTGFASFSLNIPPSSPSSSADAAPPLLPVNIPVSLGICMDLNAQPSLMGYNGWSIERGPYELADFSLEHQSRILILLNNWLDPDANQDGDGEEDSSQEDVNAPEEADDPEPAWATLEYWSARLRPLWVVDKHRRKESDETIYSEGTASSDGDQLEEGVKEEKPPHETIVIVCNRTGKENGKTFAGSSAIFSMRAGSGRPKLLDVMGRREEGVRIWNLLI